MPKQNDSNTKNNNNNKADNEDKPAFEDAALGFVYKSLSNFLFFLLLIK